MKKVVTHTTFRKVVTVTTFLVLGAGLSVAQAKVSPEEAKKLDTKELTCMGAQRAGSESGVAEYTGKWLGNWPGRGKLDEYDPGPYASEKPLFTITAANSAKYAERLTEGQKALFKAYPNHFKMHVYPSHRDFTFPKWVCATVKKNAVTAEVIHDGLGITGTAGAIAFPFPKSGSEAIWNIIRPYRPWTEEAQVKNAFIRADGDTSWGEQHYKTLNMGGHPKKRGSYQDKVAAYFMISNLAPHREAGKISVGSQPNDFKTDSTNAWQYHPGTRRTLRAPDVGFDYPVPPFNLHTSDDNYAFNGSPERYNWKIVGKAEKYIPYHNFKVNDPALGYDKLLTRHTLNPDYVRYELHRVWIVEATLKSGMRHVYGRRLFYADEDTWLVPWADNYDMRGELWRIPMIMFRYDGRAAAYHRGVTVYHDLNEKGYEATYLVNDSKNWWKLNQKGFSPKDFTAAAAKKQGK